MREVVKSEYRMRQIEMRQIRSRDRSRARLEEVSLVREQIVVCILKLYHQTCRNLTDVNDNLSRMQAVIEVHYSNVMSCGIYSSRNV